MKSRGTSAVRDESDPRSRMTTEAIEGREEESKEIEGHEVGEQRDGENHEGFASFRKQNRGENGYTGVAEVSVSPNPECINRHFPNRTPHPVQILTLPFTIRLREPLDAAPHGMRDESLISVAHASCSPRPLTPVAHLSRTPFRVTAFLRRTNERLHRLHSCIFLSMH